jgi:hypothetical protein
MTETQAKSGAADAPADPAEPKPDASANPGGEGATATGRAAVGRATVPGDPSAPASGPPSATSAPKFTRPPGMPAPPDLVPGQFDSAGSNAPTSGAATGVAVARAAVRGVGTTTTRIRPGVGGPTTGGPATGAARVSEAMRTARANVASVARGPRRARLYVKRVDPWSVMKFSFAVSFVLLIVGVVATSVLYLALDTMGVFNSVNKALADMVGATGGDAKGSFRITAKGVIFGAALLGTVNVVLFTALATLSAFIYNVCADLVGGIELTLAEKD